jgi:hypothetical protein
MHHEASISKQVVAAALERPSGVYSRLSLNMLGIVGLTLPVAHQHASLASSTTMLFPFALSSSLRYRAAEVPVIPVPTTTMSASAGSSSVVRCPSKNSLGSLCQNEFEDVGVGREARACFMACIVGSERGGGCGVSIVGCRAYIGNRFIAYEDD